MQNLWRDAGLLDPVFHNKICRVWLVHLISFVILVIAHNGDEPHKDCPSTHSCSTINPFQSYVGPRLTLWFSCSAPMSEDVRHIFVAPAPLSEPVWRFSSCIMDFGQQIAQVVLFLFLGRSCVLMWTDDCVLYSHGCACRKMAGINK